MASSSSTSTTKPRRKHDVFLSFRGEDTRVGFTSHLHAALKRKTIPTFIDDGLKRGEEISDSLVKAIEDSLLSLIIFSEHYASSKWCLAELVKILECRKNRRQIVVPIFYKVDPSDVRNQRGCFGDAFADLVKKKALEMEEEQCFRAALKEAANLSGYDSLNIRSEAKFIEEIVEDIRNRLYEMVHIQLKNLVGIDEPMRKIESLLKMESGDVRIVGIWGMGGIGKTTIAKAVYNKIRNEFEVSHFVEIKGTVVDMGPLSFENHFIKDGLHHKKVLIVFDDVDSSMNFQESLLGQHDSFGPGSRILMTSRDQHVLKQVVDETYEVNALSKIDALQLIKSKAFKKMEPTGDHKYLLERIVNYAKGNPLALVVLGSTLCDRSIEDWHSKLNGLGQVQDVEILKVLKISYDGLEKEQKIIFLNIACLFKAMDRDRVTRILEKKSYSVHFCISVLIDKSLITTFYNTLRVHDLLQEMACSIVREESEKPKNRSILVDPEDIIHVLKKGKGMKAVKGICLDMPASREIQLKSDAFAGMRRLEFLIIKGNTSKVQLPHCGLEYLSKMLRYFRWDAYPSKSLPQKFCAEYLVEFEVCDSKFEELWSGQQNLVNLRRIKLSFSQCLTKLPDLSKANQLQYVDLSFCSSLIKVPSYFQYFKNLEYLLLGDCYNLQCFPKRIDSNNIKDLSLRGCSNIKTCPEISVDITSLDLTRTAMQELQQSFGDDEAMLLLCGCSNMTKFPEISGNIATLNLDGTSIEEVPSSIQFLTNLQNLYMHNCKKLSRLSSSICKLKYLEYLDISGCSKLKSFPEIMEPMESLEQLRLRETAIRELPSSIRHLKSLLHLHLGGTLIKELPELPPSLQYLTANNCESLEIISSSTLGDSVSHLCFTNCFKFDHKALMVEMQLRIQFGKIQGYFEMVLPGSKIPQWFRDQNTGSSITIQFPSNPSKLKALAFCSVVGNPSKLDYPNNLLLRWRAKINNDFISGMNFFHKLESHDLDHMYLCYQSVWPADFNKYFGHEVMFESSIFSMKMSEIETHFKVKRCGVHLLFDENPDP